MSGERRVALVTGGARGIGLGISRALARENYDLALCALESAAEVAVALAELRALGSDVLYTQTDISHAPARAEFVAAVRRHFGRLHVLVNNAGVAPRVRADLLEATEESFERLMRINLQGPYFLTQAVAKWMLEQRAASSAFSGCVVTIASISATVASINRGDYCLSKAGLSMMTKLYAVRLAGIAAVYEIRPGIVQTEMTAGVKDKYDRMIADGLLLEGRWGQPEDVGRAVAMLARGDLPYATGQVLVLDGGLTLPRM